MARLFKVAGNRAEQVAASTAIFPGHRAPVVRLAADGARELVNLSWGFVLLQKDRAPRRVTNVRDDKLLTSPFWRDSFATRRCLVPATSFADRAGGTCQRGPPGTHRLIGPVTDDCAEIDPPP